ncbi:hypothetical protein DQ04_06541010 [Trypanosoma grayi]|uniref:hypothetical protein n=1 Tax=Trypanosoma grayi TaxID=71804 RepID=UPI0004F3F6BF|nr:hypothetical protein DQ04_06541010 [Trypanosoma grayi]KEG08736.1 hypothetical protein DQ04_06541010 [Trypanosoma grayi]
MSLLQSAYGSHRCCCTHRIAAQCECLNDAARETGALIIMKTKRQPHDAVRGEGVLGKEGSAPAHSLTTPHSGSRSCWLLQEWPRFIWRRKPICGSLLACGALCL